MKISEKMRKELLELVITYKIGFGMTFNNLQQHFPKVMESLDYKSMEELEMAYY